MRAEALPLVRRALFCLSFLLVAVALLLLPLNACGGGAFGIPRGKIQHVVVIVQENRTLTIFFMIRS
jgi:phospholipase C